MKRKENSSTSASKKEERYSGKASFLKKAFALVAIIVIIALTLSACGNMQMVDTTYTFNYAVIYKPNGEVYVEGPVESWKDYSDGDQLQIKINGVTYLTHASLCIMSTKK